MLPSEYNNLSRLDKAMIIAFIDEKAKQAKKEEKEMKKAQKRKR